jgi:menaquinone-specific isochorismate synthase
MINKYFFYDHKDKTHLAYILNSVLFPIKEDKFNYLLNKFLSIEKNYFFFHQPDKEITFLAIEKLHKISIKESDSADQFDLQISQLKNSLFPNGIQPDLPVSPFLVGHLKFNSDNKSNFWNDYEYSEWFIPKMLLINNNSKFYIVSNTIESDKGNIDRQKAGLNKILSGTNNPAVSNSNTRILNIIQGDDITGWNSKVENALKEISANRISKVVLARYTDLELSDNPDIFSLTKRLIKTYPGCYTFAYRNGDSIFIGSSPEKLFSVRQGILETQALAGSFPRGDSEISDTLLEIGLLNDGKNIVEHKKVLDFIVNQLNSVSNNVSYSINPIVKKLPYIQHLLTRITAKLNNGVSIYSVIKKLHPTPAVCGIPAENAKLIIENLELFERGLYSGALGWIDFNGNADIAVGIRSALINGNKLRAFAGCGIVEGSVALSEYKETELKLKPILSLFENENID